MQNLYQNSKRNATQPLAHYTIDQYLDMQEFAERRHYYLEGEIFEVAAVTVNHSRLVGAAYAHLRTQLSGGGPCEAFVTGLALYIASSKFLTYPDIFVVCGPLKYYNNRPAAVTEATIVFEVLSPSTETYDRGGKFRYYRSLPAFREYVLIGEDAVRVEHHIRQTDGSSLLREFSSREDRIELKSIGCALSLAAIYDRVQFDA